jgi:hypothetical protein
MTKRGKVVVWSLVGLVGFGTVINYAYDNPIGIVWKLIRAGVLEKSEKVDYQATNNDNLKAIRTALLLYHDNEEQFPLASGWMDAIKGQLHSNDLKKGEEMKKLLVPGGRAGEYGYALNKAVGGKYKGDLKPSEVLVFQSKLGTWNASGDPKTDASGTGITLDGKLVKGGG